MSRIDSNVSNEEGGEMDDVVGTGSASMYSMVSKEEGHVRHVS